MSRSTASTPSEVKANLGTVVLEDCVMCHNFSVGPGFWGSRRETIVMIGSERAGARERESGGNKREEDAGDRTGQSTRGGPSGQVESESHRARERERERVVRP